MRILAQACAFISALGFSAALVAQVAPTNPEPNLPYTPTAEEIAVGKISGPMFAGLRLRTEIFNQLFSGTMTPAVALERLRAEKSPSGLQLEEGVDFAFAAIDVGQRLVGVGKTAAASAFFQAAEQSLDAVVRNTPDSRAKDKSQYLQKLALIRGRFLNKAAQAKSDIERALVLQPQDKNLQQTKENLARANGAIFQNQPQG